MYWRKKKKKSINLFLFSIIGFDDGRRSVSYCGVHKSPWGQHIIIIIIIIDIAGRVPSDRNVTTLKKIITHTSLLSRIDLLSSPSDSPRPTMALV